VNIFDYIEKGNVDLQDYAYLKELVYKISSKSQYKICPGLTKIAKYEDLKAKLGYEPTNSEVKHDVYGKRQTAKLKLFLSLISCV